MRSSKFKHQLTRANSFYYFLGLPKEDPAILGVQNTYAIGDYVMANCTSSPSNPPATLEWLINNKTVSLNSLLFGHANKFYILILFRSQRNFLINFLLAL